MSKKKPVKEEWMPEQSFDGKPNFSNPASEWKFYWQLQNERRIMKSRNKK